MTLLHCCVSEKLPYLTQKGFFSSLMCLEEHCELLELACPIFARSLEGKGWSGFFLPICQGSQLFSCSLLFSPVPLEKDGPFVLKLCNKVNSSQDQAHFLLYRPRSLLEVTVARNPLVYRTAGGFSCQAGWFCFLGV